MIYLSAFEKHLKDEDRSPLTVAGYVRDVGMFAAWFEQTNGKALTPKPLTAMDARDYRQHLIQRQKASAATINRKLMALSAYAKWAVLAGHIEYNPTEKVKLVEQEAPAPKWPPRVAVDSSPLSEARCQRRPTCNTSSRWLVACRRCRPSHFRRNERAAVRGRPLPALELSPTTHPSVDRRVSRKLPANRQNIVQ